MIRDNEMMGILYLAGKVQWGTSLSTGGAIPLITGGAIQQLCNGRGDQFDMTDFFNTNPMN